MSSIRHRSVVLSGVGRFDPQRSALVIVDEQNDFMPGGALAVPHGDEVIVPTNALIYGCAWKMVIATQDWHPADHSSFAAHGGSWPAHCVQGTWGAALHNNLDLRRVSLILRKAMQRDRDEYSGCDAGLVVLLRVHGVDTIFVVGLATDYCVKATALDAKKAGFKAVVALKACRAVNVNLDDGEKAIAEMHAAGIDCV